MCHIRTYILFPSHIPTNTMSSRIYTPTRTMQHWLLWRKSLSFSTLLVLCRHGLFHYCSLSVLPPGLIQNSPRLTATPNRARIFCWLLLAEPLYSLLFSRCSSLF